MAANGPTCPWPFFLSSSARPVQKVDPSPRGTKRLPDEASSTDFKLHDPFPALLCRHLPVSLPLPALLSCPVHSIPLSTLVSFFYFLSAPVRRLLTIFLSPPNVSSAQTDCPSLISTACRLSFALSCPPLLSSFLFRQGTPFPCTTCFL